MNFKDPVIEQLINLSNSSSIDFQEIETALKQRIKKAINKPFANLTSRILQEGPHAFTKNELLFIDECESYQKEVNNVIDEQRRMNIQIAPCRRVSDGYSIGLQAYIES